MKANTEKFDALVSTKTSDWHKDVNERDYFGKSEPPFRQSEPPAEVGWICR